MPDTSWKDGFGLSQVEATVADSGTKSGGVDLKGALVVGLHVPTGFDGTTVAFEAGDDAGDYRAVKDETGAAVALTVAAGTFVQIPPAMLAGVRRIKLVVDAQTGAVTLFLVVRPPI